VCTANRFRSPLAAACFRRELAAHKLEAGWQVSSAGTWTTDGLPAAEGAIAAARRLGFDIADHRSRIINAQLVEEAGLIVVMEQGHKEALQSEFPEIAHKVYLMSEVATGVSYDIPDPVSPSAAGEIPTEIDELIHNGFKRIYAMACNC
jgi:protein-tyrosine phosphatase